jgi:hypothetical protein
MKLTTTALAILTAACAAQVAARDPAQAPTVQTEQGVRFLNGGIGIDERAALGPMTGGMNLQLVFADAKSGALFADVDVRIADSSGREVLRVDGADPLLYAQLEAGDYEVQATREDSTLLRKVKVQPDGMHQELMHWS